jgi:hypothetical protein
MRVSIKVEKVEFDAEQCSLRLNGVNVKESEYIMRIKNFNSNPECLFYLRILEISLAIRNKH